MQSDGWQSIFKWAGWVSYQAWADPAAQSCMLGKHGLTHWDPRSTGLANWLIDHWQVHKNLPPYLAYILWHCSGVDGNNLESILVITWHRQAAFQIQYGIVEVNSDEVKQTEQDVPNPKYLPDLVILFPPSAVYMRRWIGSALIRVMVSRLFVAKPLPEPVLTYNQLDHWEQTSVKL